MCKNLVFYMATCSSVRASTAENSRVLNLLEAHETHCLVHGAVERHEALTSPALQLAARETRKAGADAMPS